MLSSNLVPELCMYDFSTFDKDVDVLKRNEKRIGLEARYKDRVVVPKYISGEDDK